MRADGWEFFSDDARTAPAQRIAFIGHLTERCSPADSDLIAAETIYGELISNVVRHGRGPVRITVVWTGGYAVISVRDSGPGFDKPFVLPDAMSESGRGLFIVRELGRDVRVECDAAGCTVRVVLPVVQR